MMAYYTRSHSGYAIDSIDWYRFSSICIERLYDGYAIYSIDIDCLVYVHTELYDDYAIYTIDYLVADKCYIK